MAPAPQEGDASFAVFRSTKDAVVELHQQRWSDAQIQQKFGLSESETPQ